LGDRQIQPLSDWGSSGRAIGRSKGAQRSCDRRIPFGRIRNTSPPVDVWSVRRMRRVERNLGCGARRVVGRAVVFAGGTDRDHRHGRRAGWHCRRWVAPPVALQRAPGLCHYVTYRCLHGLGGMSDRLVVEVAAQLLVAPPLKHLPHRLRLSVQQRNRPHHIDATALIRRAKRPPTGLIQ
jgi:hypothetical protein